jgi:hypothetical protein
MKLLTIISIFAYSSLSAQQNLIPNGSFEEINIDAFNSLNSQKEPSSDGTAIFYNSHFRDDPNDNGNLFKCWYRHFKDPLSSSIAIPWLA